MSFFKKVLVLKQVDYNLTKQNSFIGGISRFELENGVCSIHLSLINFPNALDGEFKGFLLIDGGEVFCFDLGTHPSTFHKSFPSVINFDKNFSFGVVLIKSNIPSTIVFATESESTNSLTIFNKAVAEKLLEHKRTSKKEQPSSPQIRPPYPPAPSPDPNTQPEKEFPSPKATLPYDDEAVATVNYFDDDIKIKLDKIKESDYDFTRIEDESSYFTNKEKAEKGKASAFCPKNEANGFECKKGSKTAPYIMSVKAELNEIFRKFPAEKQLENAFPNSRWAKINYDQNRFYIVGIIKENKQDRYICYGVPAKYSSTPPESLEGHCSFIPLSVFDVRGDGYWMMFQDAITGERISLE